MTRLECPRCQATIAVPSHGDPVCPSCGFTAPLDPAHRPPQGESEQSPAPSGPTTRGYGQASPAGMYTPSAPPGPPGAPPATGSPSPSPTKTSGMGVASMILGIAGACMIFIIWAPLLGWISFGPAVLAIIFGGVGIKQCNDDPRLAGRGMAVAGLVLGIIVAAIGFMFRIIWGGL